jgi:predicted dithiol-disulfide oxidoreductase (DUF899 family)
VDRTVQTPDGRVLAVAEAGPALGVARQDGAVYHTYSAHARGCDALWGVWQCLDRAPFGRNEGDMSWFHRHDEYR